MRNPTVSLYLASWDANQAAMMAQAGFPGPAGDPGEYWGFAAWLGGRPAGWALCRARPGTHRAAVWLKAGQLMTAAGQQQLLRALVRQASDQRLKLLTLDLPWQQQARPDVEQAGFRRWFSTSHLIYRGGSLPEPRLPFFPYDDSWYRPFQRLQSQAFYQLRQENDVEPYVLQPSMQDRIWCTQNRRHIFLLQEGQGLIAAGYAGGGMLDQLVVDRDCRGRGYGKALVAYGVNRLLERGEIPRLEVLDWNQPALGLYQRMGFEREQRRQLYRITVPEAPDSQAEQH